LLRWLCGARAQGRGGSKRERQQEKRDKSKRRERRWRRVVIHKTKDSRCGFHVDVLLSCLENKRKTKCKRRRGGTA